MDKYSDLIAQFSSKYGVKADLMEAICEVESSWRQSAIRYEPRFKNLETVQKFAQLNHISNDSEQVCQMTSWGLMQLMGANFRALGYTGPLQMLSSQPEICLEYSIRFFKERCSHYPTEAEQISAYNAGSIRKTRGILNNHEYVEAVLNAWGKMEQ